MSDKDGENVVNIGFQVYLQEPQRTENVDYIQGEIIDVINNSNCPPPSLGSIDKIYIDNPLDFDKTMIIHLKFQFSSIIVFFSFFVFLYVAILRCYGTLFLCIT